MGRWWDRLLGKRPPRPEGRPARASRPDRERVAPHEGASATRRSPAPAPGHPPDAQWQPGLDVDLAYAALLLGNPEPVDGDGMGFDEALPLLLDASRGTMAVPRMPAVVPQLLRSLREPDTSARALARQVAQDPVLVAAVLRRANSPFYGAARPLDSLEDAVLVLGNDGLRELVASVAFQPIINLQSGRYTRAAAPRVWAQAEACGAVCRMLAHDRGALPFEAFLAALLVNVGTIVALRTLDEDAADARAPHADATCAALLACALRHARVIGAQWSFPAPIVAALDDDPHATAPLPGLLSTAQALARLRVLVDAGAITEDDGRLDLDGHPRLARCFTAVRDATRQ